MSTPYTDFSIGIESDASGGYRICAVSSEAEAESLTRFEFDLDQCLDVLKCGMSGSPPPTRDATGGAKASSPVLDPREIGRSLFTSLFPGEVGELYRSAWSASLKTGQGLRVRLHLRPRNPELAWLAKVPWELVFDDQAGAFPSLNPLNPLVRHLDLPRPAERSALELPLRVLVVAASPRGLSALDLEGERKAMEASGRIRVRVLDNLGPEALRWELLRGKDQIIHFMGHGWSDAERGSLIFTAPDGQPRHVQGSALSHLVQGTPALGLALLNACHSAAAPKGPGADPLAGVAGALAQGGLSAVVGMQLAISDRAALAFSRFLYERLAEGDPIEAAVAEARLALYLADPNSWDWVAPVLFLRGSDSRIEEKQGKRDSSVRNQVVWESKTLKGEHAEFAGEVLDGDCETSSGDNRVRVKTDTGEFKSIIIAGSIKRNPK